MTDKYTILIEHERVPVSEDVYRAYYQEYEREKYLRKRAKKYELSLEQLHDIGAYELLYRHRLHSPDAENLLLQEEALRLLYDALSKLSPSEQALVYALFYNGLTEAQYGNMIGLSQKGVNKRKCKILFKLKKLLEL